MVILVTLELLHGGGGGGNLLVFFLIRPQFCTENIAALTRYD